MMNKKTLKKLAVGHRSCPLCLSDRGKEIWGQSQLVVRHNFIWDWLNKIEICQACAFLYSNPSPSPDDLLAFYNDGFTGAKSIGLPYCVDTRVTNIQDLHNGINRIFEVGSDGASVFHSRLEDAGYKVDSLDITHDAKSKYNDIENLPEGTANLICHYDVLEHVYDIVGFLKSCHKAACHDGYMICEVPNAQLYPENLLLKEVTHINHFSPLSLVTAAELSGWEFCDMNEQASRPFGMSLVFRKSRSRSKEEVERDIVVRKSELILASEAYIRGGISRLDQYNAKVKSIVEFALNHFHSGGELVLWGVSDMCLDLLNSLGSVELTIIDSDPRRHDFLEFISRKVDLPPILLTRDLSKTLFLICAPRYASEITRHLKSFYPGLNEREQLRVIGAGSDGKTLR